MNPRRPGSLQRVLVLVLAVTLSLLLGAKCKHPLVEAIESGSNKYKKLWKELRKPDLLRDPRQAGAAPLSLESQCVSDFDIALRDDLDVGTTISTFDDLLAEVIARAEILPAVAYETSSDFRETALPFAGGVSGHLVFYLDGKLLAILRDYADFLALEELGFTTMTSVEAIDAVVDRHMRIDGDSSDIGGTFPTEGLQIVVAREKFRQLVGALLYHEFGHYFLYHVLDQCRDHLDDELPGIPEPLLPESKENDGDRVAGFLSAKAGHDLAVAVQMYDLMAFYAVWEPGASFADPPVYSGQYLDESANYPTLVGRKKLFTKSYNKFD